MVQHIAGALGSADAALGFIELAVWTANQRQSSDLSATRGESVTEAPSRAGGTDEVAPSSATWQHQRDPPAWAISRQWTDQSTIRPFGRRARREGLSPCLQR